MSRKASFILLSHRSMARKVADVIFITVISLFISITNGSETTNVRRRTIIIITNSSQTIISRHPSTTQTSRVRKNSRRLQGTCGNGNIGNGKCTDISMCCSKWGWCGITSDYCGNKSHIAPYQNGTVHPQLARLPVKNQSISAKTKHPPIQGTCGNGSVGNGMCANNNTCCSKWGWCGTTADYCGSKAPRRPRGATVAVSAAPKRQATQQPTLSKTKKQTLMPIKVLKSSVSKGTCGVGTVGNGVCPDKSMCCSKWGWCGRTKDYCSNKAAATIIISTPVIPTMQPYTARPSKIIPKKQKPTTTTTKTPIHTTKEQSPKPNGTCGGGNIGNGVCTQATQCCSKWGWCGTSLDYCSSKATTAISSPIAPVKPYQNPPPPPPTTPTDCGSLSSVMTVNFGYYASWARYRNQDCNRVKPEDINIADNHYTHVTYAFAGINATDHLAPWAGDYTGEVPEYLAFNSLKRSNRALKTLISVGGWTFNDPGPTQTLFSDLAASPQRRKSFSASVIAFLQEYGFDGIDIDWEYPGDASRGGKAADVQNFPLLLKAIRDAAAAAGKLVIISIAITININALNVGYNLKALSKQVDFFNLMAYDVNGAWNNPPVIGANADMPFIKTSIQYMLQKGVPSNKLVLGLANYGHTFYLSNPNCNTPGCSFTSGAPGGCAGATGTMPYFTIDQYIQSKNYDTLRLNPSTGSMEMVTGGNNWISFDNSYTLIIKANYAAASCMRGVMWWSVDQLTSPIVLARSNI